MDLSTYHLMLCNSYSKGLGNSDNLMQKGFFSSEIMLNDSFVLLVALYANGILITITQFLKWYLKRCCLHC